MDPDSNAPSSVQGRVLSRLRTAYPESRTKTDLIADRLIGGTSCNQENAPKAGSSTTYCLKRLKGSRTKNYIANLARGEGMERVPFNQRS